MNGKASKKSCPNSNKNLSCGGEKQKWRRSCPASPSQGQKRKKVCPLVATTSVQAFSSSSTPFQGIIAETCSSRIFPRAVCLPATHSALCKQHGLWTWRLAVICRAPHMSWNTLSLNFILHNPILSFRLLLCIKARSGRQLQPHPSPPPGLWAHWLNTLVGLMMTPLF